MVDSGAGAGGGGEGGLEIVRICNDAHSLMTRDSRCNHMKPVTFVWTLESDSIRRAFQRSTTVPHGGPIESL